MIANAARAAGVIAVFGASGVFAEDLVSKPAAPAVAQANEPVPAPLEIPPLTNSNPPTGTENTPAAAPAITAVPPPAPVPEAPKVTAEAPPPPPPPTPSDLLGLSGKEHAKERAKAEKCLANAVYFESRGELMRGQVAVAQVVLNRVFSPYYPKDICSVVYQNAHMHLACQFTFACDGRSKAITERGAWARAMRVAKQALDGKVWIAAVAKSTHYHAFWVNPSWVAEMKKMYHYGVHTFYRPHRWGDGAQEAGWVVPEMALIKPVENKAQQAPAKPVTKVEAPTPIIAHAKTLSASSAKKPTQVVAQPKSNGADIKAKTAALNAKPKPSATDSKAKAASANAKAKTSAADSKTKPSVNAQSKVTPANSKAKHLPLNAQAKASQKVSAQ